MPDVVKHCCQDTLTAQWTKRLPFLQQHPPAKLAAEAILEALSGIADINTAEWTVIDFCSGAGGRSSNHSAEGRTALMVHQVQCPS